MVRDRADFGILLLACVGCALIVWGIFGKPFPEAAIHLSIAAMGLPLIPAWLWHSKGKRRADTAEVESKETITYARHLTNQEKELSLATPKAAPVSPPPPDYTPGWRVALHRFVTAGEKYGFDVRSLAEGPHRVVAWDDWALLVGVLREAGILVGGPGKKTRWATGAGWSWARWEQERATLPLPHPNHTAPEVDLTVQHATQQRANNAPTVVEGEPSRPG